MNFTGGFPVVYFSPNIVAFIAPPGFIADVASKRPMKRLPAAMRIPFIAPNGPVSHVVSFTAEPSSPSTTGVVGYSSGLAVERLIANPGLPVAQLLASVPSGFRSLHM